jgi:hypothetical protein
MAVKRRKKKSKVAEAYEQSMLAEGAPAALDLLGLGSTIGDIIRGNPRKAAKKKRRAKKKTRARVGRPASRKARAKVGRPPARRTKKKSSRKTRRKSRRA